VTCLTLSTRPLTLHVRPVASDVAVKEPWSVLALLAVVEACHRGLGRIHCSAIVAYLATDRHSIATDHNPAVVLHILLAHFPYTGCCRSYRILHSHLPGIPRWNIHPHLDRKIHSDVVVATP
jgi:hypothetical protein